jgi:hypothetical protein
MPKYTVSLHGTGCRIEVTERRFGLIRHTVLRPAGFYTTRFVEAATPEEAEAAAVTTVLDEVKGIDRSGSTPTVIAEEVREDAEGYARHAPGSGFSWYLEGDGDSV